MNIVRRIGVLAIAAYVCPQLALAQTSNSSIVGDVTDQSGGAIPGATVIVTDTGTGIARTVTTSALGTYRVYPLNPGTYEVRASSEGFQTQVQQNIQLQVGAVLEVGFELAVGQVTETVEVTGAAPIMQTQEASVGGVVDSTQIERIPVNGRNYTRLMILMAGTSDQSRSQSRGTQSGTQLISVNGQRTQDNNFTLDGVDNNIMMQNSPGSSPPMDSIQEFRVATGNSAEYGRSSGANVNVAVKSGTRDLHGSAYWYVRNDKFDANPWFNNFEGIDKTPYRQNQYGFALGGPVVLPKVYNGRDKTFWFVNWEGYRRRRANTLRLNTPTAEMRAGNFEGINDIFDPLTGRANADGSIVRDPFANNQVPASRMSPAMTTLMDLMMPTPNAPGLTRNYIRQESLQNDRDMIVMRGDHHIGDNDIIFARYLRQRVGQYSPNANPNMFAENRFDVDNLAVGWNHIFSPSSVLEFKYAFNHPQNPNCTSMGNTTRGDALAAAGITLFDPDNLCNVLPSFAANGWFTVGGGGGNEIIDSNHQFIGSISKTSGQHTLKAGANFTYRQMDGAWANPSNGNMAFWRDITNSAGVADSGNSVATMLLGFPSDYTRGLGTPRMFAKQPALETFFQDDWRVTSKLTVNLGVRYEMQPRPHDANDAMGNLLRTVDPQTGAVTARLMWAGINPLTNPETGEVNSPPQRLGFGRGLMSNDWNDFAPRVGIAYKINSKTVIRTGAGVFYNSTFMQESQDLRKFWPYLPQQRQSPNRGAAMEFSVTDAGPSFDSTQAIGGWPQGVRNRSPYSVQWNLFVQRQLTSQMTVEVGYVGSSNKKQIGYSAWNNAVSPGPGSLAPRRLLYSSGFSANLVGGDNMFNSEYNALQIKLNRRLSNGLQLISNYTYGNCMDEYSSLARGKMQNQFDRSGDWSRCNYDIRHAFKAGYVYDLPFGRNRAVGGNWHPAVDAILGGWAIEGLVQLQSGTASNPILGRDNANVGWGTQRPDVVGDPNSLSGFSPDAMFNTAAFATPAPFTFGNSGALVINDPGRYILDVSVMKRFIVREGHQLELRGEFFNFPNATTFVNGHQHNMSAQTFGTTRSATTERQIQLALRYSF